VAYVLAKELVKRASEKRPSPFFFLNIQQATIRCVERAVERAVASATAASISMHIYVCICICMYAIYIRMNVYTYVYSVE